MTTAELLAVIAVIAVIARWSACHCMCARAPTDYCVCVTDASGQLVGFFGGLATDYRRNDDRPVADDCDRVTAKDKRDGRK